MNRYSTRFAQSTLNSQPSQKSHSSFPSTLAVMAIAGVGVAGWFLSSHFFSHPQSGVTNSESDVYVAYQVNTPVAVKLATYLNYDLSRQLNSEQRLNVDVLQGERIENVYSNLAQPSDMQQLNQYFHLLASDDTALVQAVQRVANLAAQKGQHRLNALIVTTGTSNPTTIKAIQSITQKMADQKLGNVQIYLMGLTPTNKLSTSAAFHPVRSLIGGSCTNDYSQCRPFVEELAQ